MLYVLAGGTEAQTCELDVPDQRVKFRRLRVKPKPAWFPH